MSAERPTIFLAAAEASGDAHGARLIQSLRRLLPNARFLGAAGPQMTAAGCESIADLTAQASMLTATILKLGYFVPRVIALKRALRRLRPDVFVPIDSPALNWHLAATAKACDLPVVYYIAPQVWAWAPWRVRKLARLTDRVACILPFEQRYLRDRGVRAVYVGHPLFDTLPAPPQPRPDIVEAFARGTWRVALLPGSRPGEIHDHTPGLLACAEAIRRRFSRARCTFAAVDRAAARAIRDRAGRAKIDMITGRTTEVLAESHLAVVASGTATLEAAHFAVPMVVFYRASRLLRAIHAAGRPLGVLKTPHLSLVNILAGRRVVPELMPWHGKTGRLTEMVMEVMDDLGWLVETQKLLPKLVAPLRATGGQTASDKAARLVAGRVRGQ